MEVRENQIEEILAHSPIIVKDLLALGEMPKLVGRQISVPSGRLDLLYLDTNFLILIELKVVPYHNDHFNQIIGYKTDLLEYQRQGKMVNCPILSYIFVPSDSTQLAKMELQQEVFVQAYNPEYLLEYFYKNSLKPITSFVDKKPIDIGIWNIHLINDLIYQAHNGLSYNEIKEFLELSDKTFYNKVKFAKELGLIEWNPRSKYFSLTKLGIDYSMSKDLNYDGLLSESQAKLLRNQVIRNPYESSIIVGIASMVECVFSLAKITYPVPMDIIQNYYAYYSGKVYNWQTDKSKKHGLVMYSNYAIDLGLLAKTDKSIFITPEGIKFVLQLQLHKGLKLLEKVEINFE